MPLREDTPIYQELIREGKWDVPILEPDCKRVQHNRMKKDERLGLIEEAVIHTDWHQRIGEW